MPGTELGDHKRKMVDQDRADYAGALLGGDIKKGVHQIGRSSQFFMG